MTGNSREAILGGLQIVEENTGRASSILEYGNEGASIWAIAYTDLASRGVDVST
jgi:hypothetical protein